MKYFVKDLEKILNAKKINLVDNKEITGIAIDSRKVKGGDLFIPFLGENVDGHNYIESAFEKGEIRQIVALIAYLNSLKFLKAVIFRLSKWKIPLRLFFFLLKITERLCLWMLSE